MITPIEIVQRNIHGDLPVVSKVPRDTPPAFIRVDMSAPQRINELQYETLIIVQVYARSQGVAIDSFDGIQADLEDMPAKDDFVSGWKEQTGPYPFPDPDTSEHYRWQMTGTLHHTIL